MFRGSLLRPETKSGKSLCANAANPVLASDLTTLQLNHFHKHTRLVNLLQEICYMRAYDINMTLLDISIL